MRCHLPRIKKNRLFIHFYSQTSIICSVSGRVATPGEKPHFLNFEILTLGGSYSSVSLYDYSNEENWAYILVLVTVWDSQFLLKPVKWIVWIFCSWICKTYFARSYAWNLVTYVRFWRLVLNLLGLTLYIYIYIHICIYVCVCVCVCFSDGKWKPQILLKVLRIVQIFKGEMPRHARHLPFGDLKWDRIFMFP